MATNTPKTASFGDLTPIIAPDIAAEQLRLARQQALVDILRKQSLEPLDSQVLTGAGPARVVPINPLTGMTKLLAASLAGDQQDQIDQKNLDLNRQYASQIAAMLGGQGQGAPASSTPSQPAIPPSDGGQLGSGTFGMQIGGQSASQPPAAQPQSQPQSPPFAMANLLRGALVGQVGGEAAGNAYWKQYDPTDATRAALQGGMDPVQANRTAFQFANTDPSIRGQLEAGMSPAEVLQNRRAVAQKDATMPVRPDQTLVQMPGNGAPVPLFTAPAPGDAGYVTWNQGQPQVNPLSGAASVIRQASGARTAGQQAETIRDVTLPGGGVAPVRGKEIGAGGTLTLPDDSDARVIYNDEYAKARERLRQAQAANDAAGVQRAQDDLTGLQREAKAKGIQLGQGTAEKVVAEGAGNYVQKAPQEIQSLKQSIAGLDNAYAALERLGKSGPGVGNQIQIAAVLQNWGLPVAKDATTNYQTLKKYLANAGNMSAGANGASGSDARLDQFLSGQPNAETMNVDALKSAISYVQSQQDAGIAERQFVLGQSGNDPNKVQAARQQWATVYDPKVFEFNRLSPPERAAMVRGMTKQQLEAFRQKYNFANQQGWVQ